MTSFFLQHKNHCRRDERFVHQQSAEYTPVRTWLPPLRNQSLKCSLFVCCVVVFMKLNNIASIFELCVLLFDDESAAAISPVMCPMCMMCPTQSSPFR